MAASINGVSDPFGRYARGTTTDRSERSDRARDRSDAASASKLPPQVDFAQALEALEKANAHVQNARLSFRQADNLRPSQTTKYDPNLSTDSASPASAHPSVDPVRGGLDLRG